MNTNQQLPVFRPRRLSFTRKKPRTDSPDDPDSNEQQRDSSGTDVEDDSPVPRGNHDDPCLEIERSKGLRPRRTLSKRRMNRAEEAEELKHMGMFGSVCLEVVLMIFDQVRREAMLAFDG
ncbi:hypothetical protein BC936DRAFT_138023 [Jimgerdemannia flammicorona]|uniref:Uncharacterized protein n=1 Tax=Jimgerdemannia flammicorona TaxID=994334 RepID=A0A433CW82_9FUNG|nr:hypothetical protein BC936DRAFT_138023 [Jimgerdemannia flammicorona]